MKKLLVLAAAISLSFLTVNATEAISQPIGSTPNGFTQSKLQREAAFEKRLKLTEEQKIKAKEIRLRGHEKIKPVIEEIKAKKQEAEAIKLSRIAVPLQEEKLDKIDAELKVLKKKAHDIRRSNIKEFESILTKEQKKILKQMKTEGRQKYHETHPYPLPVKK